MVNRTRFVAEFTTNHMGNLNILLRMAEQAAWAGCDLIKMQKKDVETFYSRDKLDAAYDSPYGHTYRDYRSIFEFGREDFERFDRRCRELGVGWFATVQDLPSLSFMTSFDLPIYKVASSNARNHEFLRAVARTIPTDREIVVSVAGSTLQEIEDSLALFPAHRVTLLHCVARYPCPSPELRLGNLEVMRRRFADERVTIGYSGHEEGLPASFAAVALGAEMIERHFCLSRRSFVHHIECSLEPGEFRELVEVTHDGGSLEQRFADLPDEAFASSFGMTDEERHFLVEQTYGRQHVGAQAEFPSAAHGLAADGARRRWELMQARAA